MQKFPIDSHNNENFICLFFRPPGAANPQKGRRPSGTRVRPHANFGVNRPAGCREIVDRTRKNKNKCVSRTDTNPPFAFDIAFFGQGFTGFLQGVQGRLKRYVRCLYGYFLAVAEIRKVCKRSKIRFFSNFWAHPVVTAWPTWMALCQNVRRSVSYIRDRT